MGGAQSDSLSLGLGLGADAESGAAIGWIHVLAANSAQNSRLHPPHAHSAHRPLVGEDL